MDLSASQEAYLKQCLLRLAVEHELNILGPNPSKEQVLSDTVLLSLLYRELVARCPLFIKKADALPELQRLLTEYAKLNAFSKKAMHSDNGYFNGFLASLLALGFLTPRERRRHDESERRLESKSIETVPDGSSVPNEPESDSQESDADDLVHISSEVAEGMRIIFRDMTAHGGAERLFEIMRDSPSVDVLPPAYKTVMRGLTEALLPRVEKEMADPKKASRAATFYTLFPRRAVYGLLSVSNPLKRISGLLNLFFARPFGARSLLQRMFESAVDLPKTENQVAQAKLTVEAKYADHIALWVNEAYDPDPSRDDPADDEDDAETTRELTEAEREKYAELARGMLLWRPAGAAEQPAAAQPAASSGWGLAALTNYYLPGWMAGPSYPTAEDVRSLSQDELCAIHKLASLEMRLKDKTKFVEVAGDEQMVSLLKAGIPILCEPFVEMYEHSGMADMVMALFEFIHSASQVPQRAGDDAAVRRQGYLDACRALAEAMYQFNRNVVVNDTNSTLKDLIDWGFEFFDTVTDYSLDLNALLSPLSAAERDEVRLELELLAAWGKREAQAIKDNQDFKEPFPATPNISRLLLPPTMDMMHRTVPRHDANSSATNDKDVRRLAAEFALL